jgi:hypothetical protein
LAEKQPANERLFVEHTLSSGLYAVRQRVFSDGRRVSIDREARLDKGENGDRVYFRDACFRYVLRLMIPDDADPEKCSVIMMPVRTGGAPAGCIAAIRQHRDAAHLVKDEEFLFAYHYYHSIVKHAVRRIRTKAREAYLDLVGAEVASIIAWFLKQGQFPQEEVNSTCTFVCAMLGRVFPYDMVQFDLRKRLALGGPPQDASMNIDWFYEHLANKDRPPIMHLFHQWMEESAHPLYQNTVFDRTGKDDFIKPDLVQSALSKHLVGLERDDKFWKIIDKTE